MYITNFTDELKWASHQVWGVTKCTYCDVEQAVSLLYQKRAITQSEICLRNPETQCVYYAIKAVLQYTRLSRYSYTVCVCQCVR